MENVNIEENNPDKGNTVVMQMKIKKEHQEGSSNAVPSDISNQLHKQPGATPNAQTPHLIQQPAGQQQYLPAGVPAGQTYLQDPTTGQQYVQVPMTTTSQPYVPNPTGQPFVQAPTANQTYWQDPRTGQTYVQAPLSMGHPYGQSQHYVPMGPRPNQPYGQPQVPGWTLMYNGQHVKQETVDPTQAGLIKYEMEDIKPVITALPLAFNVNQIKQENMAANTPNPSQEMLPNQDMLQQESSSVPQSDDCANRSEKTNIDEGEKEDQLEEEKSNEKDNQSEEMPDDDHKEKDNSEAVQQEKEKPKEESEDKGKMTSKRMFCQRCSRLFFKESVYLKHKKMCEEEAALAASSATEEKDSSSDKEESESNGGDGDGSDIDTARLDEKQSKVDLNKSYSYEKGNYKCDHCRFHSLSRAAIMLHVKGHEKFRCDICQETQSSFRLLSKHKTNVHGVEHVVVSLAESSDSESDRESDQESAFESDSGDDEYYQCKKCPFKCKAESTQKAHTALHKNPKAFICSFCTQPFLRQLGLTRHITKEHKTVEKKTKHGKPVASTPKPSQKDRPKEDANKETTATQKVAETEKRANIIVNAKETAAENSSDEEEDDNDDGKLENPQKYRQQDGTYLCVVCMARGDTASRFKKHLRKSRHKFFSSKSWFCNKDDMFNCKVCKFETKYKYQFLGHVSTKKHDGYVTNWYTELDSKKAAHFLKGPGAESSDEETTTDKDKETTVKQVKKSSDTAKSPPAQKLKSPKATEQKSQTKSEGKVKSPISQNTPASKIAEAGKSKDAAKPEGKLKSPMSQAQKTPSTKKAVVENSKDTGKSKETERSEDTLKSPSSQKKPAAKKAEAGKSIDTAKPEGKLKSPTSQAQKTPSTPQNMVKTPKEPTKSQDKLKSPTSQKMPSAKKTEVQKSKELTKPKAKLKSPPVSHKSPAKNYAEVEKSKEPKGKMKSPTSLKQPSKESKEPQKPEERPRSLRSNTKDNIETSSAQKRSSQEMGKNLPDSTLNTSRENKRARMDVESDTETDKESFTESPISFEDVSMPEPDDMKTQESVRSYTPLNTSSESGHVIQTPLSSRKTATLPSDFSDFAEKPYACALCFFRTGDSEELRLHVQNHLTGGYEDRKPLVTQRQLEPSSIYQGPQQLPPGTTNIAYYNPQPYPYGPGRFTPSPHHIPSPHQVPAPNQVPQPNTLPVIHQVPYGMIPVSIPQAQVLSTEDLIDPGIDFIKEPANPSPYQCLYCRMRHKNLAGMVGHFESQHRDILHAKIVQDKMRREAAKGIREFPVPDQSDASSTTVD